MSRRPAKAGFSLVEALVAVILAGGGIAALVTALGSTERAEARTLSAEKMLRFAEQKLQESIATKDFNSQSGDFTDQGAPDLDWTLSQETTSVDDLEYITVTVSKADGTGSSQSARTLFYQTQTASAARPSP